ncbi:MAG TPA: 7-carboxy-7-deazaguanine synthase [Fimbriimonadales bacterium]|nr:7-carboxy-7-deazaguanine synthase [Fimbriimonadales bacterium]
MARVYSVKEIYYTLQGEGANAGRAAVFLRFSGCNLWSGQEDDRAEAICSFCDTDFVGTDGPGGGKFVSPQKLAEAVSEKWKQKGGRKFVVCTGGEPLLQLDIPLIRALHEKGFEIAIETNGTIPAPPGIDWICVSPKAEAPLRQISGDELKLVFPQDGLDPAQFENLSFKHFFLQPMDCKDLEKNIQLAVEYCLQHPRWRLSLQMHKLLGLP